MTRKKKTRSLKRIHSVKTGNTSKLKRAAAVDRQNSNLKAKNKTKSVYQKFLEENPEAAEAQVQNKPAKKPQAQKTDKSPAKKPEKPLPDVKKAKKEPQEEQEVDLLSQLDNKNFNDLY